MQRPGCSMNEIFNFFNSLPVDRSRETLQEVLRQENLRIERIVSYGQCSPEGFWYDQDEEEWVLLLAGSAEIGFAGDGTVSDGTVSLQPGDFLLIPAHARHRVEKTAPEGATVWLAVYFRRTGRA